jgi:hypothetical protein
MSRRRATALLPSTSWRRGGRYPRLVVWWRGLMGLLSVGEAARYQAKTGRNYLYCADGYAGDTERCLMPAVVQVEYENQDDNSWSSVWLCAHHAARFRKAVERDERREAARLPRPPGGRLKRQGRAVTAWANLNNVEEVLTEPW